jgi:hypothetical protein
VYWNATENKWSVGSTRIHLGSNAGGSNAGQAEQSMYAVAIGSSAGCTGQQFGAVAIGSGAGAYNQGQRAIAIGAGAGQTGQHSNSIVLNAMDSELNPGNTGFFVAPVRQSSISNINDIQSLAYDPTTKEIMYISNFTTVTTTIDSPIFTQNNRVIIGSSSNYFNNNIISQLTVECWFRAESSQPQPRVGLVSRYYGTSVPGEHNTFLLSLKNGNVSMEVAKDNGTVLNVISSTIGYNDSKWHHAAATFKSTESLILYVDGSEVKRESASVFAITQTKTADLEIGGYDRVEYLTTNDVEVISTPVTILASTTLSPGEQKAIFKTITNNAANHMATYKTSVIDKSLNTLVQGTQTIHQYARTTVTRTKLYGQAWFQAESSGINNYAYDMTYSTPVTSGTAVGEELPLNGTPIPVPSGSFSISIGSVVFPGIYINVNTGYTVILRCRLEIQTNNVSWTPLPQNQQLNTEVSFNATVNNRTVSFIANFSYTNTTNVTAFRFVLYTTSSANSGTFIQIGAGDSTRNLIAYKLGSSADVPASIRILLYDGSGVNDMKNVISTTTPELVSIGLPIITPYETKTFNNGRLAFDIYTITTTSSQMYLYFGGTTTISHIKTTINSSFNGAISDVRIWNVARTGSEILSNYQLRLSGTDRGLLSYFKLDKATANYNDVDNVIGFRDSSLGSVLVGTPRNSALTKTVGWDTNLIFTPPLRIGAAAGQTGQQAGAVAVGSNAGVQNQGQNAIAIGANAGKDKQGANAIAIGNQAGTTGQLGSSIVLNATGSALNPGNTGLHIAPIRQGSGTANILVYDLSSKEVTYNNFLTPGADLFLNCTTPLVGTAGAGTATFIVYPGDDAILKTVKTVECWFNTAGAFPTASSSERKGSHISNFISKYATGGVDATFSLGMPIGTNNSIDRYKIRFYVEQFDNGIKYGTEVLSPLKYNDSTWHHVAGVINLTTGDGSITLYIDGNPVATKSLTKGLAPLNMVDYVNFVIGSDHAGSARVMNDVINNLDRHYTGYLSDVRMWSTTRTDQDISSAYYSRLKGEEAGLILYLKLINNMTNSASSTANRNVNPIPNPSSSLNISYFNYPSVPVATATLRLGVNSGLTGQQSGAIAIGSNAGAFYQGANAIAIGVNAGATGQPSGSIVLNATGSALNPVNTGFFVKPLRATSDISNNTSNQLVYNQISGEMQYFTTINGQTSAKFIGSTSNGVNNASGISFTFGIANDFKGVECWFKATPQSIGGTLVSRYQTSPSPFQFALALEPDSSSLAGSVRFHISHSTTASTQLNTKLKRYDDNLWHHVAATFDSRAATFTGSISGTTLTVSSVIGTISVGQLVYGPNVASNTRIIRGSGTNWTVDTSQSQTVAKGSVFSLATFNGSISGTTLTVSSVTGTTPISFGQLVYGSDVANDTYITGGGGTIWTVNNSQPSNTVAMGSAEPSKMYIYMDGGVEVVEKSTASATIRGQGQGTADNLIRDLRLGIGTDHAWITNTANNRDRYFVGNISDVRIWNIFRPLDRVVTDHKVRLYGTEPGLVFYAKLDETSGDYKTTPTTPSTYIQTGSHYVVPDTAPISSKTFVIDHPIHPNKYLVHACLEGPEAGVYYRGKGEIVNGTSVDVQLPAYVGALCPGTDFTVQLTPIYDGTIRTSMLYASEVDPGTNSFRVYGENGRFNWLVHGKRFDIEVEPNKADVTRHGDGPYTYLSQKK